MTNERPDNYVSLPLSVKWKKGLLAIAVILVSTAIAQIALQNFVYTIIAFLILCIPITQFLIPTTYEFHDDHMMVKQLMDSKKAPYSGFDQIDVQKEYILLTKKNRKRIRVYIYIFDEAKKTEIAEFLKGKINGVQGS